MAARGVIRFVHASDLHLGKPFGGFPDDVGAALRQARQAAISRLAQVARDHGATHVLLAGDTFDAETPQPTTIRHALNAMRADEAVTWVILPGNHDSLAATELWRVLTADRPANVLLAMTPEPLDLGAAMLLPAPLPVRHPGRDLTDWMDTAATGDRIRIGLAHGAITDFRATADQTDGPAGGVIAPDRAGRAGLAYLALGDWHGRIEVAPETWYCGTPEPDSFKPHSPAGVLVVGIEAPGAPARVLTVPTGVLNWHRLVLDLTDADDAAGMFGAQLPPVAGRASVLASLVVSGRARLPQRLALEQAAARVEADFLWWAQDLGGLGVAQDSADLDLIDTAGALRSAAERLSDAVADGPSEAERKVAQAALARLFSYALDES